MSIDERQRHELYQGLAEALGTQRADTLMSMLPPVGWADVATKQDLDVLRAATKQDLELQDVLLRAELGRVEMSLSSRLDVMEARLRTEIADFRAEMHSALRTQLWGILGGIGGSVVVGVLLNAVVS
jgi:hypothetical protein